MKKSKLSDIYLLKRSYEKTLVSESVDQLMERPHWDFESARNPLDPNISFETVDFKLEDMKNKGVIDDEQLKKLSVAFYHQGIVGKWRGSNKHLFFSNGAKGQPELSIASKQQIELCPHLPDDWEDYVVNRKIDD